jgi:hypothetical protein
MCLLLQVQAIQAGQVTVEDHFMSELGMHPLKVIAAAAALFIRSAARLKTVLPPASLSFHGITTS